jgi:ferritin-like protein
MSHEGYHEPYEQLPEKVRDLHRAFISLMEELEAVDWYYQRAAVTNTDALREILLHNAHEEIEHAMMVLEWIRRSDPLFDANMRKYLFTEGSIVQAEAEATGKAAPDAPVAAPPALRAPASTRASTLPTLGSLREGRGAR